MPTNIQSFRWIGQQENTQSAFKVEKLGTTVLGYNHGYTSFYSTIKLGDWEFAVLNEGKIDLDAVDLIASFFEATEPDIIKKLSESTEKAFIDLRAFLESYYGSKFFAQKAKEQTDLVSSIVIARKENYVLWFSVGNNFGLILNSDVVRELNVPNNGQISLDPASKVKLATYSMGTAQVKKNDLILLTTTKPVPDFDELREKVYSKNLEEIETNLVKFLSDYKKPITVVGWLYTA